MAVGSAARDREAGHPARSLFSLIVAGTAAATITSAVTGLKYLHILSEGARAALR